MALSNLNFDSISKFAESIKDALHAKAVLAVETKSAEMKGISEEVSDDSEVEISFDEKDLQKIRKIADSVGVKYEVDDKDELTITDDDSDKIDAFLTALDDAGINYSEETEEDDIDEGIAAKRVHTSASDKAAHKKAYRKNKGKLKVKAKRYRKTAHAKRLMKKGARKAKQGKTATGRRIIKRV